jgi:pimeloyl-ACP methyl ester carboxylesterase
MEYMNKIILSITLLVLSIATYAQEINGTWKGELKQGTDNAVKFIFKVQSSGDSLNTIIEIPTRGLSGLRTKSTRLSNNQLLIDASNLGFRYIGKRNSSQNQIEGFLEEGVNKVALNLFKEESAIKSTFNRPQEPIRPFPYFEEEVLIRNEKDNVSLSGTITLPKTPGKYPAVVLVSGSGPQDRDETFATHKTFLVLADYLTRHGIAVLRYDDRGVGKSTGDHYTATTNDFATDAASAILFLKSRPEINSERIGIIGHSEGAIIAPLVANRMSSVAFLVLLGGTGINGAEVSVQQAKSLRGFPVPDEASYELAIRQAIKIASQEKAINEIRVELQAHYTKSLSATLKPLLGTNENVEAAIKNLVATRTTPWMRYFYTYNPSDALEKVKCPVLALNGDKDVQVNSTINQTAIRNALAKAKNKDFTVKEMQNLNHMFQECKTGSMQEYPLIEQTISPALLEDVSQWINKRSK